MSERLVEFDHVRTTVLEVQVKSWTFKRDPLREVTRAWSADRTRRVLTLWAARWAKRHPRVVKGPTVFEHDFDVLRLERRITVGFEYVELPPDLEDYRGVLADGLSQPKRGRAFHIPRLPEWVARGAPLIERGHP